MMVLLDTEAEPAADEMAVKQGGLLGEWSPSHPCHAIMPGCELIIAAGTKKVPFTACQLPAMAVLRWHCWNGRAVPAGRFACLIFVSVSCSFIGGHARVSLGVAAL